MLNMGLTFPHIQGLKAMMKATALQRMEIYIDIYNIHTHTYIHTHKKRHIFFPITCNLEIEKDWGWNTRYPLSSACVVLIRAN